MAGTSGSLSGTLQVGLTVLGNLAADRVDGGRVSAGGCPTFAAAALGGLRARGARLQTRIVGRCAAADAGLFDALRASVTAGAGGADVTLLESRATAAFALRYRGERRTMRVRKLGEPWTTDDLSRAAIHTSWVHVAPLLRGEFPPAVVKLLRAAGHTLSFDGQGLVRVARLGPLVLDRAYDSGILGQLRVLKLDQEEATVLAGGAFSAAHARRLRVPEILVTHGPAGAELYLDGAWVQRLAPPRPVRVQSTGAGDIFAVAYAGARASGSDPVHAAELACELAAELLERRAHARACARDALQGG